MLPKNCEKSMFSAPEPGSPKWNVKLDAPVRGPAAAIPSNAASP